MPAKRKTVQDASHTNRRRHCAANSKTKFGPVVPDISTPIYNRILLSGVHNQIASRERQAGQDTSILFEGRGCEGLVDRGGEKNTRMGSTSIGIRQCDRGRRPRIHRILLGIKSRDRLVVTTEYLALIFHPEPSTTIRTAGSQGMNREILVHSHLRRTACADIETKTHGASLANLYLCSKYLDKSKDGRIVSFK